MKVIAAMLCDAASVRENLLSVLGAGITYLERSGFPTPMTANFAGLIEYDVSDIDSDHTIVVKVARVEGGEEFVIVDARGELERPEASAFPGAVATLPFSVDLQAAEIDAPGDYYAEVTVDGKEGMRVRFAVTSTSEDAR